LQNISCCFQFHRLQAFVCAPPKVQMASLMVQNMACSKSGLISAPTSHSISVSGFSLCLQSWSVESIVRDVNWVHLMILAWGRLLAMYVSKVHMLMMEF
jgi:hypothetical protein